MTKSLASALLLLLALCGCRSLAAVEQGPIVVASDLANPPFAWVDDSGVERGRDVEMMQALALELGRELQWERMPFDQLLQECEAGRIDVVCATLGITEERAKRVTFTRPYFETSIAVVVRLGADEPQSLADLKGLRVSAGAGTTSRTAVERHLPESLGVFEAKENQSTAERLASRDVDAAVMDGPAAATLAADSGGTLRVLPERLASERYALCIPHDGELLARELDLALEKLHTNGTLLELNSSHGLSADER
ncbi:MAG: glutamine transport system substrate-binding protein [Planctomycetota bacterium]|jgi:glutamine transport system substrate-binding protein